MRRTIPWWAWPIQKLWQLLCSHRHERVHVEHRARPDGYVTPQIRYECLDCLRLTPWTDLHPERPEPATEAR